MPVGPTSRRQFDSRDLDPQTRAEDLIFPVYNDRRARRDAYLTGALGDGGVRTMVYVRPVGNGQHLVRHPTDRETLLRLPSTQGAESYAPGQRVFVAETRTGDAIFGNPPGGEKGLANRDTVERRGTVDVLQVIEANPAVLDSDSTTAVTLIGLGFNESPVDVFTAEIFDEATLGRIADPYVTIGSVAWVSATEVLAQVTVSASGPDGHRIGVNVERA